MPKVKARRAAAPAQPRRAALPEPMSAETRDQMLKAMYEVKAQTPEPYTQERWDRMKTMFRSSIRILEEELDEMLENGEFDE